MGWKDIGIIKFEFVAKTQFFCFHIKSNDERMTWIFQKKKILNEIKEQKEMIWKCYERSWLFLNDLKIERLFELTWKNDSFFTEQINGE